VMTNVLYEITEADIINNLRSTGETTWALPINSLDFGGMERVRLDTLRVWLEGVHFFGSDTVYVNITTSGNYLDSYRASSYQFNSKGLIRPFKYREIPRAGAKGEINWTFDNGDVGQVILDGKVDNEVSYAYFRPTPFSEWSISLLKNNPGVDYSNITKITMYFEGTAIGSTMAANKKLSLTK